MSIGNPNRDLRADGAGPKASSGDRRPSDPTEAGRRDAAFVALLRAGDPTAFGLLFDSWADPVYDRVSHQGFTTADVCELSTSTFAAAHRRLAQQATNDPFRVLLFRSARQEMAAAADRRVQYRMPVGPYAEDRLARGADPASLGADPAVAALLWDGADVLGERVREVLDLHHRHGLPPAEIAAVLDEPVDTIDDILRKLPMGYGAVVRAQVLWRQGSPSHDALAATLAGTDTFDTGTVRRIAEHQRECVECREIARLNVDPVTVFGAIPLAAAPLGMNEVVVERLVDLGVPMTGSVSYRDAEAIAAREPGEPPLPSAPPDDSTGAAMAPPPDLSAPTTVVPPRADAAAESAADRRRVAATGLGAAAVTGLAASSAAAAPAPGTIASGGDAPSSPAASSTPTAPTGAAAASRRAAATGGAAGPGVVRPAAADAPDRARRWLWVAVGLVVVVAVAIVVVLTKGPHGSSTQSLTETGVDRPVITTTIDPVSSTAATTPTTTGDAPTTTPDSAPATTTPGTPTTTRAVVPAPGQPAVTTTTAVPFPNFTGTTFAASTSSVLTASAPITISWNVVADKPVTVTVSGPNFSSSAMSGTAQPVCPVPLVGGLCNATPGVYSYVLAATDSLGRAVYSKTIQFTVTPRS